ncbi:a-factor receptor [Steccherinum ochraceum]|uniref:A-factor receptor n=1 Tax=Steccherinum ochraceum TaxID=92696 RepID=A0A4R0R8X4_9APHY|nr:a-factor receptor [Steccherinum ochraceum]
MAEAWHHEMDALAAFSLLGFFACYVPLAWHFQSWNLGVILYIFWTGTQCLVQFVNMMVWRDNAVNSAPAWCEIAIRFTWMARIGTVASGLVIARRLCMITTATTADISRREKIRSLIIELAIGAGIPLAQLIICQFISIWFLQGHRYDIMEGIGCMPAVPATWVSQLLSASWPLVIGVASACYSVRTVIILSRRRRMIKKLLTPNKHLNMDRYLRLLIMAYLELLCTIPMSIYVLVFNSTQAIYEYRGLTDLHLGFDRVRQYPYEEWSASRMALVSIRQMSWTFVAMAFLLFALFGFTQEARNHYRSGFIVLMAFLRISVEIKRPRPVTVFSRTSLRIDVDNLRCSWGSDQDVESGGVEAMTRKEACFPTNGQVDEDNFDNGKEASDSDPHPLEGVSREVTRPPLVHISPSKSRHTPPLVIPVSFSHRASIEPRRHVLPTQSPPPYSTIDSNEKL